ncbi:hypothetical protein [Lysinibacillus phage vB_LspM-01]|nr:hypothetical protein [Lysinibacillus phage vB_LspM-01]
MEVVKVKEKDLNLIKEFAKQYTLSDLFDTMNSGRELEFKEFKDLKDRYGYDKVAAIWLGHYEIEKTLRERIVDKHNKSYTESFKTDEYDEAFRDGLKWVLSEIDKDGK